MGSERIRTCGNGGKGDKLSVPPGFVSLTSFKLKRVAISQEICGSMALGSESEPEQVPLDISCSITDSAMLKRSLSGRPWICYDQYTHSPEERESERLDTNLPSKTCLTKGVIRGCPSCSNCRKVIARWHPEQACVTELEEAPVFHPSEKKFADMFRYIASIRPKIESYGICRIVPPPSWQPPCLLKEKNTWESSKFTSYIQRINELQHVYSESKLQGINGKMMGKRRRTVEMSLESGSGEECTGNHDETGNHVERVEFEPGPEFTLRTFKKYADYFQGQYFCMEGKSLDDNSLVTENRWKPSVDIIEVEYRRNVENPSEEIEVLYGAELDSMVFGSGFPAVLDSAVTPEFHKYAESDWNLNNINQLSGSLLAFESDKSSAILHPQLFVGMCFSSLCWRVEEHHLYSMCYMHLGAPKVWYSIPGRYYFKFEAALKKYFPNLLVENPEFLQKMVTLLSPSILKSEGIPVYRCVQHSREFVLVLPGTYYSAFDCGFNCAEKSKFAPFDWLPHGQNVVELYAEQGRKTIISHDKLLLGAAMEAVRAQWEISWLKKDTKDNLRWKAVCGKEGILAKALKSRIKQEGTRRKYLCNSSQSREMEEDFDSTSKRECSICFYDLHLSATGCPCSPDRYSCLKHAKKLCSCAWSSRFFLFRYSLTELDVLVEALEGKLSAVYRWSKEKLGLTMYPSVPRDTLQVPTLVGDRLPFAGVKQEEFTSYNAAVTNGISRTSTAKLGPEMRENMRASTVSSVGLGFQSKEKVDFLAAQSSFLAHLRNEDKAHESEKGSFIAAQSLFLDHLRKEAKERESTRSVLKSTSASNSESTSSGLASDKKLTPKLSSCQADVILISDDEGE